MLYGNVRALITFLLGWLALPHCHMCGMHTLFIEKVNMEPYILASYSVLEFDSFIFMKYVSLSTREPVLWLEEWWRLTLFTINVQCRWLLAAPFSDNHSRDRHCNDNLQSYMHTYISSYNMHWIQSNIQMYILYTLYS